MANVGRPLKFKDESELSNMIKKYFDDTEQDGEHLTVTGLALHLGFESRQSFYDYEEREEFSYTIKRARMRIENAYEKNLHGNNPTGSIFALKNFGWKDKQEVENKHEGEIIITRRTISGKD